MFIRSRLETQRITAQNPRPERLLAATGTAAEARDPTAQPAHAAVGRGTLWSIRPMRAAGGEPQRTKEFGSARIPPRG
jgi:hypothetical protein